MTIVYQQVILKISLDFCVTLPGTTVLPAPSYLRLGSSSEIFGALKI